MNQIAITQDAVTVKTLNTPIGLLSLTSQRGKLVQIEYRGTDQPTSATQDACLMHACAQIEQYFLDPTTTFQIPFILIGTPLQKKIWQALMNIPCGCTLSYGDLAERLQTHPRVIGNACRANPLPIVVPCHRIVAANNIGGYMGKKEKHLKIKRWLLEHEIK